MSSWRCDQCDFDMCLPCMLEFKECDDISSLAKSEKYVFLSIKHNNLIKGIEINEFAAANETALKMRNKMSYLIIKQGEILMMNDMDGLVHRELGNIKQLFSINQIGSFKVYFSFRN